jgi:hypothetical protein
VLREVAGRLGVWIRGAGLDGDLGDGDRRAGGCGRLAFIRDWNISRLDFDVPLDGGAAATSNSAQASRSDIDAMIPLSDHFG